MQARLLLDCPSSFVTYPPIRAHRPDNDPGQHNVKGTHSHWHPHLLVWRGRDWEEGVSLQMSRECAAGRWRAHLPIPWFFVPGVCRFPFAVRSRGGEGGTTLHLQSGPPAQSSPPPPWTMPAGIQRNFAECRPLECAASNKDHVSRIGHSHAAILLAQDFVRFHLRAAPCPEGRITRKTGKPNRLGEGVGKGMVWGYQPFFEEEHVPAAQPTNNNNYRPAPRRKRPATKNQNKPG